MNLKNRKLIGDIETTDKLFGAVNTLAEEKELLALLLSRIDPRHGQINYYSNQDKKDIIKKIKEYLELNGIAHK